MALFQTDNLRVEKPDSGAAILYLDVADRPVNVFSRRVLQDFDAALDAVAADPSLKLFCIRSVSPSKHFAGADVQEFAAINTPDEARSFSELGQKVFDKLAALPAPSLVVIGGACLGGGLEMALACDYRLVIDQPKTQLGLPEIELGLIPGWGGTQRLPRVVGLERALRLILTGRKLGAREALRWKLADALASGQQGLAHEFAAMAARAMQEGKRPRTGLPLNTWRQRLFESTGVGRSLIFRATGRMLKRRVPDDMPAPQEALETVRVGLKQGIEAGMDSEREAAARLASGSACRNLVRLFFLREKARKVTVPAGLAEVRRVGVIGAGTMGAGIAQLALFRGYEVVVQEVSEEALGAGTMRVAGLLQQAVARGLVSDAESQRRLSALRGTLTWEGFGDVDLVVEAAAEDLDAKKAVFRELDQRTRPNAVLATNTSSLRVAALQEGLSRPGRVAALHFFSPVHKMPLVEVGRSPATDDRTAAALTQWAVSVGKTPVQVKDSPGFLVNRVMAPYLNEAVALAVEGMPIKRVDQEARRFGMLVGPLELLDQAGLDVAARAGVSILPAFGERFKPNPVLERMVAAGWLGQKNGLGFYRYRGEARRPHAAAAHLVREVGAAEPSSAAALPRKVRFRPARDRMVLLTVNEAAACLGEGLAANADAIDLALMLGTGWAPHRGGPLRYGAERGYAEVVRVLEGLARQYGPRFEPCAELRRLASETAPV